MPWDMTWKWREQQERSGMSWRACLRFSPCSRVSECERKYPCGKIQIFAYHTYVFTSMQMWEFPKFFVMKHTHTGDRSVFGTKGSLNTSQCKHKNNCKLKSLKNFLQKAFNLIKFSTHTFRMQFERNSKAFFSQHSYETALKEYKKNSRNEIWVNATGDKLIFLVDSVIIEYT